MSNIKDLKFDDKNFNRHTSYGMSLLEKSLRELGAGRSILLDKDNNIIAGNGIVEAAGSVGLENVKIIETTGDEIVAVKRTDMTIDSKEGREMALADNATANADLSWDEDNIKEQTEKWDFDTSDWGGDFNFDKGTEVEEDEVPEANENEPAKSKLGEVYHLGNHRLMCGDSTDAGSVAILMDGQKADMVFTDPPYGMNLDTDFSSMKSEIFKGGIGGKKYEQGIVDDFKPEMVDAIFDSFGYVNEVFLWGADYYAELLPDKNKGSWIVWDKRSNDSDDIKADETSDKMYGSCFELCWSKTKHKREIARVKWAGIFGMYSDDSKRFHPTQKPVALSQWFLKRFSKSDERVVDLFGGSGSTLIACEQLGRKCYMMELDPKYCDVIRKRYWKLVNGSEEGWQDGTRAE